MVEEGEKFLKATCLDLIAAEAALLLFPFLIKLGVPI
jgi:hypothetical protein